MRSTDKYSCDVTFLKDFLGSRSILISKEETFLDKINLRVLFGSSCLILCEKCSILIETFLAKPILVIKVKHINSRPALVAFQRRAFHYIKDYTKT